jgi:hypothetical protein
MIVPASMPWLAMAEYDQLLQEAAERGRLARLKDRWHRPATPTRLAATDSRWAARPPRMHPTAGASH